MSGWGLFSCFPLSFRKNKKPNVAATSAVRASLIGGTQEYDLQEDSSAAITAAPRTTEEPVIPPQQYYDFVSRVTARRQELNSDNPPAMDPTTLKPDILEYAYSLVLNDPELLQRLQALKPGQGLYYKRDPEIRGEVDAYDRTVAIFRRFDGEYELVIETKSKLASNLKREDMKWPAGTEKVWKTCYRVDTDPIEVERSGILKREKPGSAEQQQFKKSEEQLRLNLLLRSISASNQLFNKCPRHFMPVSIFRDDTNRLRLYSPHGGEDLFAILKQHAINPVAFAQKYDLDSRMINFGGKQLPAWKVDIMYQIVQALVVLEKLRINHNDFKTENVVCQYDHDAKRFRVKIIDPFPSSFDNTQLFLGTRESMAPEFFLGNTRSLAKQPHGIAALPEHLEDTRKRYGGIPHGDTPLPGLDVLQAIVKSRLEAGNYNFPSVAANAHQGKADMWAAGIVFFDIIYGTYPKLEDFAILEQGNARGFPYPLNKMLDINAETRITPTELLAAIDAMPEFADAKRKYAMDEPPLTEKLPEIDDPVMIVAAVVEYVEKPEMKSIPDLRELCDYCADIIDRVVDSDRFKILGITLDQELNYIASLGDKDADLTRIDDALVSIYDKGDVLLNMRYSTDQQWVDIQRMSCAISILTTVFELIKLKQQPQAVIESEGASLLNILQNEFSAAASIVAYHEMHGSHQQRYGMV